MPESWPVFRGDNSTHDGIDDLPAPPPWRGFGGDRRGDDPYVADAATRDRVNAALLLRRPLLATGRPGTGKSALAYAVANELGLGRVLHWPITSRSTIQDGLYTYDGLGRLQDGGQPGRPRVAERRRIRTTGGAGDYVTLGPLGTALHSTASSRPRVLLIDEFDKGDADLAYDLLNVLEEGTFHIPELERGAAAGSSVSRVATADPGGRAVVRNAVVQCESFPFIVLTSNGYREFPPALLRRCIRVDLQEPTREQLADIVRLHLGAVPDDQLDALLNEFLRRRSENLLATDQLLNAVYLVSAGVYESGWTLFDLANIVLRNLGESA